MTLHLSFKVAGVEYALPVEEILQMESFSGATWVPGAPKYVAGVVTVRGRVVPVIDLRLRFGLSAAELSLDTRIIVTRWKERVVALRVDAAREVLELQVEKHQPAPEMISERSAGYVRAVHTLGTRVLLLLDLKRILGEHDDPLPTLPVHAATARPQLPS